MEFAHLQRIRNVSLGYLCAVWLLLPSRSTLAELPAFPGAVGQGAAATGGRGGDVYHVTNLDDYDSKKGQTKIPGSLRHAIRSAEGPRTIVFDVGGAIALAGPLEILKDNLTIAGQTSPTGITLWGYPVEISRESDIVFRHVRIRMGDFHARPQVDAAASQPPTWRSNGDLDTRRANAMAIGNGCDRVILDHVSVAWGIDETLSVTEARNVTVQHSLIAEGLNDSFHPKGPHGYGSLIRGLLTAEDERTHVGGYTFYGNLWAHNRARNPSIGGEQRLPEGRLESERRRTDLNLVNNVIYDWRDQPTHRSSMGDVRVNFIGNYYINGPAKRSRHIFNEDEEGRTELYHADNWHDADQDSQHNGRLAESPELIQRAFRRFGEADLLIDEGSGQPFGFYDSVADSTRPASDAYEKVVASVGAWLWRDAIDWRIIESLVHRVGNIVDSQESFRKGEILEGIDDLEPSRRPADFDRDRDGMADEFERAHGLNPHDASDRNDTTLSEMGYTNLEVYLNSLAERE